MSVDQSSECFAYYDDRRPGVSFYHVFGLKTPCAKFTEFTEHARLTAPAFNNTAAWPSTIAVSSPRHASNTPHQPTPKLKSKPEVTPVASKRGGLIGGYHPDYDVANNPQAYTLDF